MTAWLSGFGLDNRPQDFITDSWSLGTPIGAVALDDRLDGDLGNMHAGTATAHYDDKTLTQRYSRSDTWQRGAQTEVFDERIEVAVAI